MKAMVFAAGLGTRLKPLTDTKPKALVSVGGIPMIQHVIMRLKEAGVSEIVVNVHHFADMIVDFLHANSNFGCDIHISDESRLLLDTGGGILHAQQWLDGSEPFIVHNADIITDLNLRSMYEKHLMTGADASLLVADRQTSRYLLFDDTNRLCGWINRNTGETRPDGFVFDPSQYKSLAFGGIHIVSPSIFSTLTQYSADEVFSIIPYYLSQCKNLKFMAYVPGTAYRWCDIGKPTTLQLAEQIFGNG